MIALMQSKVIICYVNYSMYILGAILLAQWMQATQKIDGTMVTHQLDEIATAVGTHLLQANGGMTGSHDVLSAVKELSLPSLVILEAINNVLYNQYKFTGSGDDYYNPLNSYINKVLTLFVLYIETLDLGFERSFHNFNHKINNTWLL